MRKLIGIAVMIVVLLLGIAFACLNHESVTINYFIGQSQLALSLLLVIAFAAGGIIGLLVSMVVILKQKTQNHLLKRQLKKMEHAS